MTDFSLPEALSSIVSEPSPPEALRKTLLAADRLLRPRSSFISIFDAHVQRLNIALTKGRADRRIIAAIPGEGTVGIAFKENRIVREGNQVALPMIVSGEALGALVVIGGRWEKEEGPSQEEQAQLQSLANAAAAVVALAKAREEADRRTRELENAFDKVQEGEKTRDAVLSHLSHELRTPLTTIKAYLGMGLKGRLGTLEEPQRNALEICERNADRLLRLINDLLLTARLQFGKMTLDPRPLGLRSVIVEAVELLRDDAKAAGVEVSVEAPSGEVFVQGNRDRMVEGFMHLLERGFQGNRRGEKIHVEVGTQERSAAVRLLHSGMLVPGQEVDRLFQAFRPDGGPSNLGLSIAQQIFGLHGGSVRGESAADGLLFHVNFPLFAGAVATGARGPSPRRGEILVVEDDDDCRNGIVEYLAAEQFQVRAFSDGQRALERIREVPPALLLVDLRIPGVDGAMLIQHVREGSQPTTPIYVISGAIDAQSGQEEAWGAKVDGVFEKPINFPYLLERVREYVAPA